MNEIYLKSERLNLRPINLSDLNNIHQLHSLPETDEFNTLGIPENIEETKVILDQWISENQKEKNQIYTFVIEFQQQFVGLIALNLGKEKYKNAEFWYKLHANFWNKGFATEALKTLINFAFNDLKLHRITAGCAVENKGSIRVLEKVGMTLEGRKRQILPLKTGWSDNFEYAILETDFINNII
jgi:[ribosomal protein S5]-alanine N-acetyltransferase